MSFKIDNEVWIPESTTEHANSIMERINTYLQENEVKDSEGNIVQLSVNFANAIYLLCLASGSRLAENDEKLNAAINSFNIELCDDQQIEHLLPIAAIERNQGSYSTLKLTCKAKADGDCTIVAGTKAPYKNYNFIVQADTVISAGESAIIDTKCDTLGAITILTGEITSFEDSISNLETVRNLESSVPGTAAETTNELRQRILAGDTIKYSLDGCRAAIEGLTGINYARLYFNYSTTEDLELVGGVELQPRHAYLVVFGESDKLATTYAEYMSAPTQNGDNPETAKSQNYVTESGQIVPIYYDKAFEKQIFVKVMLSEDAEFGTQIEAQIKSDLITSSASWEIGEDVTSLLTGKPFVNCTYTKVAYTLVSEDGEDWENLIETDCNVIPRIKDSNIEVEQLV